MSLHFLQYLKDNMGLTDPQLEELKPRLNSRIFPKMLLYYGRGTGKKTFIYNWRS
jgi:hypothetical protein